MSLANGAIDKRGGARATGRLVERAAQRAGGQARDYR